jgi:DNA repair protein RadC
MPVLKEINTKELKAEVEKRLNTKLAKRKKSIEQSMLNSSEGHTQLADHAVYKFPRLRLQLVKEDRGGAKLPPIRCPNDAAKLLQPLRNASEEHFVSFHLNAKSELIGMHEVSHGTLSESLVHPREVFKAALVANSYSILVCHNHPSGSELHPSREDFATTEQLVSAAKILGVEIIDHLIVGPIAEDDQPDLWIFSFREWYPEIWK